ncbi:MAG: radical SAM protein [bacterium]
MSTKSVQHGLERRNTGKIQSLWLEFWGYCNLGCPYCYACGGEHLDKAKLLKWEDYERVLLEAKSLGIDSIGIPGAGEPFLPINKQMVMRFLHRCKELRMFVTLFTTGEFITDELASELYNLPVEIMLKCNSLTPEVQDRFVSDPKRNIIISGYGEKRNRAIMILTDHGFNNNRACMFHYGRPSRMALVTSIMTTEHGELSNLEEIVEILRFCRRHNIIFDCDTILKQGRGASCELCTGDRELKAKLLELQKIDQEEFGNSWQIGPGYVGTVCDRYMHHLYMNQEGELRPCIGAMGVNLGNIKTTTLKDAWESKEMQMIRNRQYGGKCAECQDFVTGKCNSCLGRHTKNLTSANLLKTGQVETIGCWNFQQKQ